MFVLDPGDESLASNREHDASVGMTIIIIIKKPSKSNLKFGNDADYFVIGKSKGPGIMMGAIENGLDLGHRIILNFPGAVKPQALGDEIAFWDNRVPAQNRKMRWAIAPIQLPRRRAGNHGSEALGTGARVGIAWQPVAPGMQAWRAGSAFAAARKVWPVFIWISFNERLDIIIAILLEGFAGSR
jgi:hypothetical protein